MELRSTPPMITAHRILRSWPLDFTPNCAETGQTNVIPQWCSTVTRWLRPLQPLDVRE
jgi:hypothetical protein